MGVFSIRFLMVSNFYFLDLHKMRNSWCISESTMKHWRKTILEIKPPLMSHEYHEYMSVDFLIEYTGPPTSIIFLKTWSNPF